MTTYLEEAAAELRDARDANHRRLADTAHLEEIHPERIRLHGERLRIAEDLLTLAAIEAGLPPGCCRCTPVPEETP